MHSVAALIRLVLSLPAAVSDMGRAGAAQMGWFAPIFAAFLQVKLTEVMLSFTGLSSYGETMRERC